MGNVRFFGLLPFLIEIAPIDNQERCKVVPYRHNPRHHRVVSRPPGIPGTGGQVVVDYQVAPGRQRVTDSMNILPYPWTEVLMPAGHRAARLTHPAGS